MNYYAPFNKLCLYWVLILHHYLFPICTYNIVSPILIFQWLLFITQNACVDNFWDLRLRKYLGNKKHFWIVQQ